MKTDHYELRRLRLIAASVKGNNVLDIGYAAFPNPYLKGCHRVGFDLMERPVGHVQYEEHITGNVTDLSEKLNDRKFDTIICGEFIEHLCASE